MSDDDTPRPAETAPVRSKVDPEALVLRAPPRRVVRFRRGLIVGAAGLVSAGLAGLTWLALEPPSFRLAAEAGAGEPLAKAAPDALADAPATYGDVPPLGPPLPGDLGRPILEHRREVEAQLEAPGPDPAALRRERALAAEEAEQERRLAARTAARAAGVIVPLAGGKGAAADGTIDPAVRGRDDTSSSADDLRVPGSPVPAGITNPSARGEPVDGLKTPPSPWTLSAGTSIPASLITGLNSDLPGMVVAQVTEHVRDSATGRVVLVPQGARLIGNYDNRVGFGQRRALLVWQRILFPDGSSVILDNAPATDLAGYAGISDRVDVHTWRLVKGIALSTLIGVGNQFGLGGSESELVRALREATQQNAARAGDRITARNLDIQPTLRVRPGWPVRAVLHRDIALRPWQG